MADLLAIFFTFSTYGSHLHGDERGSVDRHRRAPGTPLVRPDRGRVTNAQHDLKEAPFVLDAADRTLVLDAVVCSCRHRSWQLFAAHIRTNHVHLIANPTGSADRALAYLKARASHALKYRHTDRDHFWTKHGSTRFLWSEQSLLGAMHYVLHEQGTPMQIFPSGERSDPQRSAVYKGHYQSLRSWLRRQNTPRTEALASPDGLHFDADVAKRF